MQTRDQKKIIAMFLVQDKEHLQQLLSDNHYAFLMPGASFSELKQAVNAVSKGKQYISTRVTKYLVDVVVLKKVAGDFLKEKLPLREKEITGLIAEGLTSKKIAVKLNISVDTVDTHRRNILKKLGLHNVAALIKYASSRKK